MKQILIIHGGDSFLSYEDYFASLQSSPLNYERLKPAKRWKDTIVEVFTGDDVLTPTMPNKDNAKFNEWVIQFEKIIPFFGNDVRLIGHSLGAMFLAKYLHERPLEAPVSQLILLAGGYDENTEDYGEFRISSAKGLEKSARSIHIMHSKDDPVVPYEAVEKYARDSPSATVHRFENRNHFLDAEFPELIELLKL